MKTIYVSEPLGIGNVYAPRKKNVDPFTVAGTGLSFLTSIVGGIKSAAAMDEFKKNLRVQKASDDAGFTRQKYESVLDKASGQNLVRRVKQIYDGNTKRVEGAQQVAGGTAAATQQAKDSANQAVGDTIANIAAMDSQRQDRIDAEKRANDRAYTQQMAGLEAQRAQNITNAAQQASNALMSVGSAVDQMNAAKVDVKGSANNSTPVTKTSQSTPPVGGVTNIGNTWYDEQGRVVLGNA